jgi:hypothetical protein
MKAALREADALSALSTLTSQASPLWTLSRPQLMAVRQRASLSPAKAFRLSKTSK